jgi:hypothetical protein
MPTRSASTRRDFYDQRPTAAFLIGPGDLVKLEECMVAQAVGYKPVSHGNSLQTGIFTGNFAIWS